MFALALAAGCVAPSTAFLPADLGEPTTDALRVETGSGSAVVTSDLDTLSFTTVAVGRGRATTPLSLATAGRLPDGVHARVFEGVTEWWGATGGAIEQGWIVDQSPEGEGALVIHAVVEGAAVAADGAGGLVWAGDGGGFYRYSGIKAWDADGVELPARLSAPDGTVHVEVDAAAARYPVTIDPVIATSATYMGQIGGAWSTAGDVNGDGYDDLVAGGGSSYLRVYYGSVGGPSAGTYDNLRSGTLYRGDVEGGDFDGDGYQDIAVGGFRSWPPGGEFNVHYGATARISTSAGTTYSSARDFYAYSIGAGDFNGDGYDDLGVGSWDGYVDVFNGSATGLSSTTNL
jgi:hypothetical protein